MADFQFSPEAVGPRITHFKQTADPLPVIAGHSGIIQLDWRRMDKLWIHVKGSGTATSGGNLLIYGLPYADTNDEILCGNVAEIRSSSVQQGDGVDATILSTTWAPTILDANGLMLQPVWLDLSLAQFSPEPVLRFHRLKIKWDETAVGADNFTFDAVNVLAHFGEA